MRTVDPLPEWQLKTFEAYLPYVLGVTRPEDEPLVRQATERFDAYVRSIPAHESTVRDNLATLLALVCGYGTILALGTRPWHQTPEERERFVRRFFEPDGRPIDKFIDLVGFFMPRSRPKPTVRDLAKSLREVMGLAFYSNPESDRITRYQRVWERKELFKARADVDLTRFPGPRPTVFDPLDVAQVHFEGGAYPGRRYFRGDGRPKVAVIGSGAGGAVVAARLAELGKYDVAIFEAGPRFRPNQYPLDTLVGMSQLFEGALMTLTRNLDVHLLRGRLVGGGTVMTSGLSVRPRDRTKNAWTSGLEDETYMGIDPHAFDEALDEIQKRQALGEMERIPGDMFTDISDMLKRGVDTLGSGYRFDADVAMNNVMMRRDQSGRRRLDQNGERCLGCGLCNYGCYFGHKLSMDLTFIPDAEAAGARVHANVPIRRLVGDYLGEGRMRVRGLELGRGPDYELVEVDHVVLAGGAVGSPALLKRSAAADGRWRLLPGWKKWVGTHLGFNYGSGAVARYGEEFGKPGHLGFQIKFIGTKSTDEDLTLDGKHDPFVQRWVMENAFVPPGLLSNVVPGVGDDHRKWMEDYRRLAMCASTIGSPMHGVIDGDHDVRYRLQGSECEDNVRVLASIARIYLASGAKEVGLAGIRQGDAKDGLAVGIRLTQHEYGDHDENRLFDALKEVITEPEHLMLSSAHPQGGLRMSEKPGRGAVDKGFRLRGADNVFVSDASLFPSTIVVNPQWTIAALGWLAGEAIDRSISS